MAGLIFKNNQCVYIDNSDEVKKFCTDLNKIIEYKPREDISLDMDCETENALKKEALERLSQLIDEKYLDVVRDIFMAGEKRHSFAEFLDSVAPKPIEKSVGDQIKDVKQRLKHCKNFMERKSLEKELESLYKLKKGKMK